MLRSLRRLALVLFVALTATSYGATHLAEARPRTSIRRVALRAPLVVDPYDVSTETQEPVATQNITGADTAITDELDQTPIYAAAVKLYLNGVLQQQGAGKDYTISGKAFTWLASSGTAADLTTSDTLVAVYRY